jgi:hypothetical protein
LYFVCFFSCFWSFEFGRNLRFHVGVVECIECWYTPVEMALMAAYKKINCSLIRFLEQYVAPVANSVGIRFGIWEPIRVSLTINARSWDW